MQSWEGEAISIFARKHSENDVILEVFSQKYGRVSGYVFGGVSRKKRAMLEQGQIINLEFLARSENSMGVFERLESVFEISAIITDRAALCALKCICELLHETLPENMANNALYEATKILISNLGQTKDWAATYVRWEAGLLANIGFGLDLSECALSGVKHDLAWISPKTGRAATRTAGEPFKDKLLPLPAFLVDTNSAILKGDVADGLALTGWFLERDALGQGFKTMPESRARLIYALGRAGLL